jgi:hypothetical protein
MTPDLNHQLAIWRQRALIPSNQPGALTKAEMFEITHIVRNGRQAALQASDAKRTAKAKAAIPDGDTMLQELLGDLG